MFDRETKSDGIQQKNDSTSYIKVELPHIIFTDSHFDAAVWKIIKKIAPKLKSFGYQCFFLEAPEGTSLEDWIKHLTQFSDPQKNSDISDMLSAKWQADHGDFPKEYFYNSICTYRLYTRYCASIASIECANDIVALKLNYAGIDLKEVADPASYNFMVSDEGIKKRDPKMAQSYLMATQPSFGLIGYRHALGMQNEILSKLSLKDAKIKFCFMHIYSESPYDEYEANLQAGEIHHPLGITLINSNEINEDKIIDLIVGKICSNGNPSASMVSTLSLFNKQGIYTPPTQNIKDRQTIDDEAIRDNGFQPAGPEYGF